MVTKYTLGISCTPLGPVDYCLSQEDQVSPPMKRSVRSPLIRHTPISASLRAGQPVPDLIREIHYNFEIHRSHHLQDALIK